MSRISQITNIAYQRQQQKEQYNMADSTHSVNQRNLTSTLICVLGQGPLRNNADPNQTAPQEQSDLGLHCLPISNCVSHKILIKSLRFMRVTDEA